MSDFKDAIWLITGASKGIGLELTEKMLTEGNRVVATSRNPESIKQRIGNHPNLLALKVDLASVNSVESAVNMAIETFGKIDVVVNNAGVTHLPTPLDEVTEEDFDRVFRVNCKSVYLMAKAFVPNMKNQGSGSILNIASTAGVSPRPNLNWYNSSKGWMNTATRTMAVELAPFGLRVNAVNPVASETPLLASFMGEDTPEMRQKFLSTIPLGRFAQPEDIANAACYLSSDEASMVTGVCMQVDGGRCI